MKEVTNKLLNLNVNEHVRQKNGLSYLSWSAAWRYFLVEFPEATFNVLKDENNIPVFGSESFGYICYVIVTAGGITREAHLPVLDGANKAMKLAAYKHKTKYGEKTVAAMSMFDINTTIQRALVKCLALFGLGLYIYSGEDLPAAEIEQRTEDDAKQDLKRKIMCAMENFSEEEKAAEIAKLRADPTLICFEHFQTLLTRREEIHLDMDDPIKFKQNQQMYKCDY